MSKYKDKPSWKCNVCGTQNNRTEWIENDPCDVCGEPIVTIGELIIRKDLIIASAIVVIVIIVGILVLRNC